MDSKRYGEIQRHRAERRERMIRDMQTLLADATEIAAYVAEHPLPWTWGVGYYDGLFYQFFDANGRPCLGNSLTDPEDAAWLLTMINFKK